jgi:hypothetical protein
MLDGREPREVKLREAGGGRRLWDVEVVFDGEGRMFLERGWERFARDHDLGLGNFLVFNYRCDAVLTVMVFDGTMCRRHYKQDDDDDDSASTAPVTRPLQLASVKEDSVSPGRGSESSIDSGSKNSIYSGSKNSTDSGSNISGSAEMDIDDGPTSQFTVMLRQCHLCARQKQYLVSAFVMLDFYF